MQFPTKARRIWSSDTHIPNSFWTFRRSVKIDSFEQATLRISSCHYYALRINGQHVTRLFHRTFVFHKQVQELDVSRFLHIEAENVIELLCFGARNDTGLMAELAVDGEVVLWTDASWRSQRCAAYNPAAPGSAALFGPEEQYDARKQMAAAWTGCDEQSLGNWKNFTRATTCDLTYDPVLGQSIVAAQLTRERQGRKAHLVLPRRGIGVFSTVLSCQQDTTLSLFASRAPSVLSINGQTVALEAEVSLAAGEHLLMLSSLGSLEVLIHTTTELLPSDWSVMVIESKYVRYPWHQSPGDIIAQAPEVAEAHQFTTASECSAAFPDAFEPAKLAENSSLFRVTSQAHFLPPDGFLHPMIERAQPYTRTAAAMNLSGVQNLLHRTNAPCLIQGSDGFDVQIIVDLGREYVGYVDLALDAAAGALLDVQCFELLDDTGCFYMHNHNGFSYTCCEGYQTFTSNYRRGCRYISITFRNLTRPLKLYSLSLQHNAAAVERIGSFTSDDALLNQIYDMSRDTAELCMLDTYVDCPGHEQNFWVGDARITALVNLLNFGGYDFNQHSIRMVGQSLSADYVAANYPDNPEFQANRFLSMAAYQAYPPASSLPMWSYLWVLQCHDHYLYSGDLSHLEENYAYLKRNMENSVLLTGKRGLLDYDGAWNLIEWAANDLSAYGEVTANSIFMAHSYKLVSELARVLGRDDDAHRYGQLAERTKEAINTWCWDPTRQAYVDTVRDQIAYPNYVRFCERENLDILSYEDYLSLSRVSEQTNTLALLYDIAPPDRANKIQPILTRAKHGNYIFSSPASRSVGQPKDGELVDDIVAIGSPFFLFFTIDALFRAGHADIAIEVMRRDWGDMLAHGTNTCWETFKMQQGHYTRSIAHAWSASPAVYLQRNVLGITPLKPGFAEFTVAPCASGLQRASGSVATPHGPIFVSWEKDTSGHPVIDVNAPQACTYMPQQ